MSNTLSILTSLGASYVTLNKNGDIQGYAQNFSDEIPDITDFSSVFHFAQSLNMLSWKKTLDKLKPDCPLDTTIQIANSQDQLEELPCTLIKDEELIHLIIKKSTPSNDIWRKPQKETATGSEAKDPKYWITYDSDGRHIDYSKAFTTLLSGKKSQQLEFDSLFLESDLGNWQSGVVAALTDSSQLITRLILRSTSGMIDGIAIIHQSGNGDDQSILLEFMPSDDISIIGLADSEPMGADDAKDEIDEVNIAEYTNPYFSFDNIVSVSPAYQKVLMSIAQVADSDTTVLITGETGTGKELLANAIYKLSDRSDQPLIKVNCAAIPNELMESILFGHEQGAFTGASKKQIGKFELADKGTIFLDEIGEMSYDLQSKLLRVLQEGEIERIGKAELINVDVRIIAATNRDLKTEVEQGRFRQDLYFRLNVFPIENIPLRHRPEDIRPLFLHFLKIYCTKLGKDMMKVRSEDMKQIQRYQWPGNIRELKNIVNRAVITSSGEYLGIRSIIKSLFEDQQTINDAVALDDVIIAHIKKVLEMTNGKISGPGSASELLDINHKTLASKIKKYDINVDEVKNHGRG